MMEAVPMKESVLPLLVFLVPTVCGVVSLVVARFRAFHGEWAFLGLLGTLGISIWITYEVVVKGYILVAYHKNFYVDGLSALLELLGSCMGILIVLYSLKYVPIRLRDHPDVPGRLSVYYGQLLLFLGMMNWTCATNNIVMLYVSVEATTLATAFLVTFYWTRESLEAGYKYLLLVTIGTTFALLGLSLIYCAAVGLPFMAGKRVLLITELNKAAKAMHESTVLLACALLVAGFGTKAGLVPFHAWLPDAHAEAPAPISALLSGIVIKVGAYALTRTVTVFTPYYPPVVIFTAIMASASMVIGILMALVQDDIKRMLAYSSVSQMGYVVEGLGLGTYLGIYGGLFHLMNHTIVKALLFLCAGAVVYATGRRRLSELGGLSRVMPTTAFCFIVGALAIGGMPPFNAFMSKITLFTAAAEAGLLWAAIIAIFTGLLTIACFVRAAYLIFWGQPRVALASSSNPGPEGVERRGIPAGMLAAMVILTLMTIFLGVYPSFAHPLLDSATRCILSLLGVR